MLKGRSGWEEAWQFGRPMIQTSYDDYLMNFSMGLVDLAWTTGC